LGRKFEAAFDESDSMIIEDTSGRLKIGKTEQVYPNLFVTGTVLALKGKVTTNGIFEATDYCFSGIGPAKAMEVPHKWIGLFENLDTRAFVAIVSGLDFGSSKEKATTEQLLRTLIGQTGTKKEKALMSKVSRVIIGGNNIVDLASNDNILEGNIDDVVWGSFRTAENN
jgi:DNA polymerase delta subunit 2